MKSCGFTCSKQALIALNIIYAFVGLVLIILPVYSKFSQLLTSWPIIGGVTASGVFLLLVAVAGIYGSIRHNQIILFFYMIILILIFIILFAFSCAALAITRDQEHKLLSHGWNNLNNKTKQQLEVLGDCCGFDNNTGHYHCQSHVISELPKCCHKNVTCAECHSCYHYFVEHGLNILKRGIGGVGLFFSFTLFVGVILAFRYRHLKDPRANPSAFL